MPRRSSPIRTILRLLACLAILSSPLEAMVPDAHDGDASVFRVDADGSRHEHGSLPDEPSHDDHAIHVCHCVHSHSGAVSQRLTAQRVDTTHEAVPALDSAAPPSPSPAEFFRPPIA